MDLSVIIVNWNTCDVLRDCLESIYEQTEGVSFEVIVVDNASVDGSAEMAANEFPQVTLIKNKENRGFAAANNQGMRIAQARYLLLLNSDTIVLDGAIQKTIRFMDQHTEAAVVGCKVLNPNRTVQGTCFMFPSLLNLFLSTTYLYKVFPRHQFFGRERMTWWDRQDVREVEVVTGCFMLIRTEVIDQVGLMDERFFVYGEETDLCWRIKNAGWKILYSPIAEIIHLGGGSSQQMRPQMLMQLIASVLLFFRKNRIFVSYIMACILMSLFFVIRLPYWLFRAAVSSKTRKSDLLTAWYYAVASSKSLFGWEALRFKK